MENVVPRGCDTNLSIPLLHKYTRQVASGKQNSQYSNSAVLSSSSQIEKVGNLNLLPTQHRPRVAFPTSIDTKLSSLRQVCASYPKSIYLYLCVVGPLMHHSFLHSSFQSSYPLTLSPSSCYQILIIDEIFHRTVLHRHTENYVLSVISLLFYPSSIIFSHFSSIKKNINI